MNFIVELRKLIFISIFFIKSIFKAFFYKDIESRSLLTQIYLKKLNSESKIQKVVLKNEIEFSFKIASFVYNDMYGAMDSRLMKLTTNELLSILTLLKTHAPATIFEFGLLHGGSLYHFLENTNSNVKIYSLDIAMNNLSSRIQDTIKNTNRAKLIQGDSLLFDPTPFARGIDFIFVDGGHEYEIVKNDTQKSLTMLSAKGIIIWDDYNANFTGVYKYLNELSESGMQLYHITDTSLVFFQNK